MKITSKSLDIVRIIAIGLLLKAISLYKISFIFGSQTAFFNGSSIAIPLVGFFAGWIGSLLLFLVRLGNWYCFSSGSLHLLAFVIPGFCASLYWTSKNSMVRFWLPLICMIAFVAHPIGRQSFTYSFYWLIPLILYYVKRENIWTQALGSTFVAHAVGSVIWLYTLPTTASLWIALLPVVAVERLLCVGAMVSVCHGATLVNQLLKTMIAWIQTALEERRQA